MSGLRCVVSDARRLAACASLICSVASGNDTDTAQELHELRQENRQLQQQLAKQQQLIDSLMAKVSTIEQAQRTGLYSADSENASGASILSQKVAGQTRVNISGEIAAGFFKTGSEGQSPQGEFRVDEARIFFDAKALDDIYGFIELNAMTRESLDNGVYLGEAYIDIERVLKWRGLDSLVNFRLGRFDIPFGEEYQLRDAIDNPLISHSLSDLWGIDEGIELYGSHGPIQYTIAAQNGGPSAVRDFTSDKAVTIRIGYEPAPWLRLSGSAMRTGDLSVQDDQTSELWFGNGLFRGLGNPATTTQFHAGLAEGDVQFFFPRGYLKLAGGGILYDDNDSSGDNSRDVYYYYAEGLLRFTKQFYGAARFSQILADRGFPIIGHGTWSQYFYRNLTDNLWRLSLGLGYTPNPNLVFKVEYTLERGTTTGGAERNQEDSVSAQAAIRF